MGSIVSIVILIFILGLIILVHELGHFFFAKKFGVYIHEFSLGMGPVIYTRKGKDGISYNIRAVPIGGFVSMAGEVCEDDGTIPKDAFLCNKKPYQRSLILVAGVLNNFILALLIFFASTLIWTSTGSTPVVKNVKEDYPFAVMGIKKGDTITKINNKKINSWDTAQLMLLMKDEDGIYDFEIKSSDGSVKTYAIAPQVDVLDNGEEVKVFGVEIQTVKYEGLVDAAKYSVIKFKNIVESMYLTIAGLFSAKISMSSLAGPIGMYQIVDTSKEYGLATLLYLTAFLSINVGFINILPFPAFDGGRIVFLIIEKIKRKPINAQIENAFHLVGFALLILLMIYVSIQDIIKLF